jgi:hypothetical protein
MSVISYLYHVTRTFSPVVTEGRGTYHSKKPQVRSLELGLGPMKFKDEQIASRCLP